MSIDLSRYNAEERAIIAYVERYKGRALTQQEINLSLHLAQQALQPPVE
jgi:hypothetical protein